MPAVITTERDNYSQGRLTPLRGRATIAAFASAEEPAMRVLDEVAAAINLARDEPGPRPVISAFGLEEQFAYTLHPNGWAAIQRHLGCRLPPLVFVRGRWFLPEGFATIWDLVE